MVDIRFYHMEQSTLDQALPIIAYKAWQSGERVMIRVSDKADVKHIDDILWSFNPSVFLPHGGDGDKNPPLYHPVWVTTGGENANDAKILILTGGCVVDDVSGYRMVCEMLDGRVDEQITQARQRWKIYKDAGYDLTYWQQDENGKWFKKQ